jgi:ribonuclease VapC
MVIDSSALLAILGGEPERRSFIEKIEQATWRRMSVATLVESSIVMEVRRGAEGLREMDHFLHRAGFEFLAVDAEQGHLARQAFSRFGKGRHRAALNYGDCFSYALAKLLGEPLLCKGDRFVHTDVEVAAAAAGKE